MKNINFNYFEKNENKENFGIYKQKAIEARKTLMDGTGRGNDYIGWVSYPSSLLNDNFYELKKIEKKAQELRKISDYLVVIGIGGSYLGAKASLDMLGKYYNDVKSKIIFLGNNVSPSYLKETLEFLKDVDFTVNVISKSGKTLEPALAFHFVKELLIEKYKDEYVKRVCVTTSDSNSIIHDEAVQKGYDEFYIPNSIGGRYSVFTAVGLLPISYCGYDIIEIIEGARTCENECKSLPFDENDCMKYAAMRNKLYNEGKVIESFVTYEPKCSSLGEWWKQLYGESEGKEGKGILPISMTFSTDLHSLGQYVQDGIRNLFETVVSFGNNPSIVVNKQEENSDQLNYLAGKEFEYIREQIKKGVQIAHNDGQVPNIFLNVKELDEYNLGYLMYFFMFSCGVSGYILDVNPFNQEGVESYKKNMFALLKK